MNEQHARTAAHWWAQQLTKHSKLDMGDTPDCAMPSALGRLARDAEAVFTQEQADAFEDELFDELMTTERRQYDTISCDYGPDHTLRTCAERVGITLGMTTFPWKTVMWIEDDKITVREGYTAERKEI